MVIVLNVLQWHFMDLGGDGRWNLKVFAGIRSWYGPAFFCSQVRQLSQNYFDDWKTCAISHV